MTESQTTEDPAFVRGWCEGMAQAISMLQENDQSLRLHLGEMTAEEVRTIRAFVQWKTHEMKFVAGDTR